MNLVLPGFLIPCTLHSQIRISLLTVHDQMKASHTLGLYTVTIDHVKRTIELGVISILVTS